MCERLTTAWNAHHRRITASHMVVIDQHQKWCAISATYTTTGKSHTWNATRYLWHLLFFTIFHRIEWKSVVAVIIVLFVLLVYNANPIVFNRLKIDIVNACRAFRCKLYYVTDNTCILMDFYFFIIEQQHVMCLFYFFILSIFVLLMLCALRPLRLLLFCVRSINQSRAIVFHSTPGTGVYGIFNLNDNLIKICFGVWRKHLLSSILTGCVLFFWSSGRQWNV